MKTVSLSCLLAVLMCACKSSPTMNSESNKIDNTMTRYVDQLQNDTQKARQNVDIANKRIHQDEQTYQENKTENN